MTDVGGITNAEFAEIWDEMSKAENHAAEVESRLDKVHAQLDALLAEQDESNGMRPNAQHHTESIQNQTSDKK